MHMAAAPAAPIALPLKYSVWRAVLYLRKHANTPNEAIDYATEAPCQHTHTTKANDVSRLPDRTVRARRFCLLEYSEYGQTRQHSQSHPAHISYRKPSPMATAPASQIWLPLKFSVWRAVLCLRIHANTPRGKIGDAKDSSCQHTHTHISQIPTT